MNHTASIAALSDETAGVIRAACPECRSSTSAVTDTRPWHTSIKRRRKCVGCGYRWTTIELPSELAESLPDLETKLRRIAIDADVMADALARILGRLP